MALVENIDVTIAGIGLTEYFKALDSQVIADGTVVEANSNKYLKVFVKGTEQAYVAVPAVRANPTPTLSGVVSNLNLTTGVPSVTIGSVACYLLDPVFYDPNRPSIKAFWAREGVPCDASIAAALSAFSEVYIDAGVFTHSSTINVPAYTSIIGSGDTNAIGVGQFYRTSLLQYNPTDSAAPAMALAENGGEAYSINLEGFGMQAVGTGVNASSGIVRRTTGTWSTDFLSRYTLRRLSLQDFGNGIVLDHAWLGTIDRVVVKLQIAGSPTGVGIAVKRGTSLSARSSWVLGGHTGWRVFTTYSSLLSCAADQQLSYGYVCGPGVNLYSPGAEAQRSGATMFLASARTYDDVAAPLFYDAVKIYGASSLTTMGQVTCFGDEPTYSGCIEAFNCTFEAGDSLIPVKPRGHASNFSFIKMHNCTQLVTSTTGVKFARDLSYLSSNVPLGLAQNPMNVQVQYGAAATASGIVATTSSGSGSQIAFRVASGTPVDLSVSIQSYNTSDAYITQSNFALQFHSSYLRGVVQRSFLRGSTSVGRAYYSNTAASGNSVYVLFDLAGVPAGTKLAWNFLQGSGVPVPPSEATAGTAITPVIMGNG